MIVHSPTLTSLLQPNVLILSTWAPLLRSLPPLHLPSFSSLLAFLSFHSPPLSPSLSSHPSTSSPPPCFPTYPSLAIIGEVEIPDTISMKHLLQLKQFELLLQLSHVRMVHVEALLNEGLNWLSPWRVDVLQKMGTPGHTELECVCVCVCVCNVDLRFMRKWR